ncbi:hypothetical protein V6N11_078688 [Hibiscus sabdariffa]|uniref:Uncharacterized protein n=1 Tax=Hibiscus sabdariffa TaxID=183260 RepID=A0ABR2TH78_9ROSI
MRAKVVARWLARLLPHGPAVAQHESWPRPACLWPLLMQNVMPSSIQYVEADFVLNDCNLENHEGILRATQPGTKQNDAVAVGYNAFAKGDEEHDFRVRFPQGKGIEA